MSLFDEIRQAAPWAKDLSDKDIVLKGAEITGMQPFEVAKELGVDTSKRGLFGAANDYAIEIANAAANLPKAAFDFVSPGNRASAAIGEFQKEGEARQTLSAQEAKYKLGQSMQSEDLGEQAKGALTYIKENPLLSASQAIGSFVGPGFAIKGSQLASGALNLSSKATGRVALGSAAATTGVMAGGDAASDAYDTVLNSPSLQDLPIEERSRMATDAARKASVVPAVIGAATSLLPGAEKALATGSRSLLKTTVGEFASEAVEEGATKLSANLAAQQYAPEVKTMSGVVGSAVLGGVLGGGTGLAVGALTKQPDSFLPGSTNISTGEQSPDLNAINKAIDGNSPEILVGPPPREALLGPQPPEQAGPPAPTPSQVQAAQQQVEAQKQQEAQDSFNQVASTYGIAPTGTGSFKLGGVLIRDQGIAQQYIQGFEAINKDKTPEQKAIFGAALSSGAAKIKPGASIKSIAQTANTFLNQWQFEGLNTKQEAADWASQQIATIEGSSAIKEAAPLNEFHKSLTGQDSPAFVTLVQQAEEKPAKATKQTKQGVENGQLQVQGNAGIREVPIQGGTTQTGGTGTGNVRPISVQPVGTTSLGEGSLGLQTGALPSSGVPTSAGTNVTGSNLPNAVQEQTEVIEDDRVFAINEIEKMANAAFGTRDAEIIMKFIATDGAVNKAKIAAKLGLSRARITQITGAPKDGETFNEQIERMAAEKWGPKLFIEGKRMGYTQADMLALFETTAKAQDEMAAETGETIDDQESEINAAPPTEEIYNTNADDVNPASSDEANYGTELGNEELSTTDEDGGQTASGYRIFNPKVSGTSELEDASSTNRAKFSKKDISALSDSQLQNLAADEETSAEKVIQIAEELTKRQQKRVSKGNKNAVQEPSTESKTVGNKPKVSKGVRKQDTEGGKAAAESKPAQEKSRALTVESKTDAEKATEKNVKELWMAEGKEAEPINPKVEPLVSALNKRNIFTRLSGDMYGNALVYVDLNSPYGDITIPNLPNGWAVGPNSAYHTEAIHGELDVAAWKDAAFAANELTKAGIPVYTRLSRAGGAVTVNEAAKVADAVEKATKQETRALTNAEQAKVEEQAWNDLPVPVSYEQLSPQAKFDWAMTVKNGKSNLAAASKVYEDNQESIAKQLADESRTIDGTDLITEVGEEKQYLMLTNQVNKLNEAQVSRLEKHYGEERDTPYFMQNLKDDVLRYIEKGAESVAGAIRDIIRQMANGVMSMAVIFNPGFTSEPFKFAVPTYETRTTQVTEQAPAEAAKNMSPAAQRAYEVIYPTIKNELVKNDKLFVVTDKPTATNFIFSPDGKLLFQSKVLIGKTEGNYYKGNNDVIANRITPAGLYNMGMREGGKTAGDYDFNKVFGVEQVENGEKYFVTMMHSVWTKESDAEQRLNALKEAGPQNSRYSFGCVNVDKETFGKVLAGHEKQMDGAKLFIVPDGNENVMEFINGKAVYSSDMVREKAEPLTKTEKVPKQGTGTTERTIAAKEEKATEETIAKQAKLTGTASVKLSTKEENPYENPWEAAKLRKNLKETFNSDKEFDDLVTIVETFADIPQEIVALIAGNENIGRYSVKGLVHEGQVYLISENIAKGEELAVLLHELGAHIGLKKLIGYKNYVGLSEQINLWMQGKGNKLEVEIANKVSERLQNWEKSVGKKEFAKIGVGAISEETVAYFIEEAVIAGINPQASRIKGDAQIVQWLRKMLASMKVALRKIGFNRFEDLTAQNIVDLAFGAANQEINGVYHGTDRDFRRFKDSYVTTFLSGWGHYTTNLRAEAKTFGENLVKALPLVDRRDLIQNDRPMGDQPRIMKMLNRVINQSTVQAKALREFLANESVENIDGSDFQQILGNYEVISQGGLYRMLSKANQDKVVEVGEIVSKFLEQTGILGSTFKPYGRGMPNRQTIMFGSRNLAIVSRQRLENTDEDEASAAFMTSPDDLGENIKFSLKKAREQASKQIDKLPPNVAKPTHYVVDTIVNFAKSATPYAAFTEDLADMAAKYIPSVKKYVNLMKERQAIRTRLERQVDNILQDYDKLPAQVKGTGANSVNKFLMDSTRDGKWAYNPGWIKDFKEDKDIDAGMEARFKALPASAQKLVQRVFAHGQDTLKLMQKSVIENINTEYDALIAAAKKVNDLKEEQELTKKKAASLADYRTLMRINAKKPYAPLKRFGDYVVVGKSKEYLEVEKIVDDKSSAPDVKAEAAKKLRELEKNDMHYFVQFAETVGEAKAVARAEEKNYAQVEDFEKDTSHTYGGRDVNSTFHRLRNLVEENKDSKLGDASERAVNRLLADLHLTLLSEQSARQSERRRRGIGGAEKDMMRAFATQGRATASFISSLENTGNIYDILRDMKEETDSSDSPGTRGDRRKYYNEFMKRHFMGMDYRPSPFMDKALSTTSAWMLLTNPAYYLQNMTQPFMMSLPVIGARYGYARSWKEMTRAYTDIASVIKKNGLSEESYNKLPEDVRNVVEVLVNRGRIDISLEQDLGRWRSTEDAKLAKFGRATELLRSMAQDIETINRVATAVAAYRLALKGPKGNPTMATDYADSIIYSTHGDYSAFNAPRITRQGLGRLATQFRKFQLIQISLIARLYNDAFRSEDADTRLIGKKALGYTIAHTAVMGGIMGLPGFAAVAALYGMLFGDEDEPDNPELALRRAIGDDDLADLLVKGVPAALGVDVSGKLGMGQMLSILPYTDVKFTRKDLPAAGYALLTGPFGGLTLKGADAVNYIGAGDYQKGLEQLLPSGLGNILKAERYASEGITTRSGDVVMKPEDIGAIDAFMVALGLPTKPITDRNFLNAAKFQYDEFYNEKASEIKRAYVDAYKEGDNEGLGEARTEWNKLQESRTKNGYTKQPLSTLLKAPQEQKKRERNVTGGVQFNKANRGFVQKTSEL